MDTIGNYGIFILLFSVIGYTTQAETCVNKSKREKFVKSKSEILQIKNGFIQTRDWTFDVRYQSFASIVIIQTVSRKGKFLRCRNFCSPFLQTFLIF